MRYFTPELVSSLNSSDSDTVDEAMVRWESALSSYQKHLQKIHRDMPPQLQPLTNLSLHDWQVLKISDGKDRANPRGATMVIALGNIGEVMFLSYSLRQKPRRIDSPQGWPLAKNRVDWLYDEVDFDRDDQKSFVHRILFSDGTTLVIPFSKCSVTPVNYRRAMSHSDLMQIA
ncbi:MAG TPA: hypothetical protein VFC78_14095 [Tepidisphaeraceae bacterium]|nr:hypothetical protein [Tepidisphaeraceae bacterium]